MRVSIAAAAVTLGMAQAGPGHAQWEYDWENYRQIRPLSEDLAGKIRWQPARCEALGDSLTAPQTPGRVAWAKRCTKARVERSLDDLNSAEFTQATMVSGLINEVASSNETQIRKSYPTFGVRDRLGEVVNPARYQAPTQADQDCAMPKLYELAAFCFEGCYAPGMRLSFLQGVIAIEDADQLGIEEIMTLDPQAGLHDPRTKVSRVSAYLKTLGRAEQTVLVLQTQAGRNLAVTGNHPMLLADGRMVAAETLAPGMLLAAVDGRADAITAIASRAFHGKVHNLFVTSENPLENVVVAEGLLTGTAYFQNQGIDQLNRMLFRAQLPHELIEGESHEAR